MIQSMKTCIYPISNLARAKALFSTSHGQEPYVDEPCYVGFHEEDQEVFLDPTGHRGAPRPIAYGHVGDIRECVRRLVGASAEVLDAVKDIGGERLIASVKDADGRAIGPLETSPAKESSR